MNKPTHRNSTKQKPTQCIQTGQSHPRPKKHSSTTPNKQHQTTNYPPKTQETNPPRDHTAQPHPRASRSCRLGISPARLGALESPGKKAASTGRESGHVDDTNDQRNESIYFSMNQTTGLDESICFCCKTCKCRLTFPPLGGLCECSVNLSRQLAYRWNVIRVTAGMTGGQDMF